jgi:hypothetical protein
MTIGQTVAYLAWCEHHCYAGYERHSGTIVDIGIDAVKIKSGSQFYEVPKSQIVQET